MQSVILYSLVMLIIECYFHFFKSVPLHRHEGLCFPVRSLCFSFRISYLLVLSCAAMLEVLLTSRWSAGTCMARSFAFMGSPLLPEPWGENSFRGELSFQAAFTRPWAKKFLPWLVHCHVSAVWCKAKKVRILMLWRHWLCRSMRDVSENQPWLEDCLEECLLLLF